ncbi:MAG TPA: helix-turn-helix transcriptional regulator [Bryobacteraceae bacterium]|nr:helix-turn-helix transcriptional regulator [Bryobacteraceae bacterium]
MYPNLKMQMWKVGIRQNRLAQLLHMDETAFSRIVNGFRKPNGELREKIALALNCDQDWLFEEVEPMNATLSDRQTVREEGS